MRFSFLESDEVQIARRILILGEGDGRFLKRALEALPNTHFTVLDDSLNMISRAREQLTHETAKRVEFVCANALTFATSGRGFDGLVMHCFLDCFTPSVIKKHLPCWLGGIQRNGWVWIGDFVEPPNHGWQWIRLRILYQFFGWVTGIRARYVYDVAPLMKERGWALRLEKSFASGALSSRLFRRVSKG